MLKYATPLLITSSLILAGCAKKAPEELPPAPAGTSDPVAPPPATGPGYAPGSQGDFLANTMSDRILFDTDRYNVDAQDQVVLQSQAQWLAQHPNARITVEGHADERGTRDYNLALGERRANAAKNYLASLGVSPTRMTTVSYGKERPDALGSNEAAWAQNRRAVSIVVQ
ncbi:peptidoglycan-associated lipoprotein Pal [Parasphingorhabdus cellanae]|uniref:Peptidoglycan-associated lipoprotein n=1 Tax=Parasphingorhabdus cellanae TaxID=2806553 RepID=A0ABX7T8E9_9SPHN|nr:peptidoglycan-associated lipoprotein Pal [Parasphingorhabdus cellanae]QTD57037.1 peptidoglycan-associated lipoprotein Pal [Parasphingorhabdus cellanae]